MPTLVPDVPRPRRSRSPGSARSPGYRAPLAWCFLGALAACVPSRSWRPDGSDDTAATSISDPAGSIVGRVLDGSGAAAPGARLATMPHGYETQADDDGLFRLAGLPPDIYTLGAAAEGWSAARLDDLVVGADATVEVEIRLGQPDPRDGRVEIVLVGPDEAPLVDARVVASTGQEARTDATGTAVLDGLGGAEIDLDLEDAAGALWPARVRGLVVPEVGGLQLARTLAGRPPTDATPLGSALCSICHSEQGESWAASAHGEAGVAELNEPLGELFTRGLVVDLPHGTASLEQLDGTPTLTLVDAAGEARSLPVAGVLGDPDRGVVFLTASDDDRWALPIAWVAADLRRPGFPDAEARLVASDVTGWFDADGRFAFPSLPEPASSVETRCLACHVSGSRLELRDDGSVDLSAASGAGQWMEPSVGCERCHGPGSAHMAASTDRAYRITRPDLLDAERASAVCGQCHGGTHSLDGDLPFPWTEAEGLLVPGRLLEDFATSDFATWASGAAAAPGQQSDEHAASAHGQVGLRCTDCHDPHGAATDDAGAPLPAMLRQDERDNSLCASCHLALHFDDDLEQLSAHPAHLPYPPHGGYDPAGETEMGRCTGCHQPGTTARLAWSSLSGAGDRSSHLFVALPPQDTVDEFDAVGADVLPVGDFPGHACLDCHAWNAWRAAEAGDDFGGPSGDPTERLTHERLQTAYEGKFP